MTEEAEKDLTVKGGSAYMPDSEKTMIVRQVERAAKEIATKRQWPKLFSTKPRRTNPDQCEVCHGTAGNAALKFLLRNGVKRPDRHLTLYRGKWYCPLCLDKARRGIAK